MSDLANELNRFIHGMSLSQRDRDFALTMAEKYGELAGQMVPMEIDNIDNPIDVFRASLAFGMQTTIALDTSIAESATPPVELDTMNFTGTRD